MTGFSGRMVSAGCVLASLIAPPPAMAFSLSMTEACTLTVNSYAWYLDHPGNDPARRAEEFADLFTAGAILTRPNDAPELETFKGRTAIAKSYLETTAFSRMIYLSSNIRIMPATDTTATGTSYLTVYMHATSGSMKDAGAVTAIMENRDEYEMTGDGCRISSRNSTLRMISTDGAIQPPQAQ